MGAHTIRPGRPEDSGLILQLVRELAAYEKLEDEVVATEDEVRTTLFGPRPQAEVLIAEIGDEAAGLALYFHNYSTFLGRHGLYLEDLYVRPERRGQGIGLGLFRAVAGVAVERGCGRMEWSVLDWNTPAIEFYESLGAGPMQNWTVYRLTGEALNRAATGSG